ncbi:MAG: site-specific DNA-methyltransferase [Dehalococcoidia bacterium]|nr:site-specific DNA-methyltransferase [Dehalococcoidia bacterium]
MAHWSENARRLKVKYSVIKSKEELSDEVTHLNDVCLIILPSSGQQDYRLRLRGIDELLSDLSIRLGPNATLIVLGEVVDLVRVHAVLTPSMRYQHWVSIRRRSIKTTDSEMLPLHHFGALVYTKYKSALRHVKTRIQYTYCPACDKTTKDYGGKKHVYHEYGTLLSDVWRDIACDLEADLTDIIIRFADLLGVHPYEELGVLDCRQLSTERCSILPKEPFIRGPSVINKLDDSQTNQLILGDCLEKLARIPDNSVDFAFADPPYNLRKKYAGYDDDMEITQYFDWCDRWIGEIARVLRPGRTCAVLNIPFWAIRHFLYMETILTFQNWIVWDALAFPVRLIMPAHYAILCFAKGSPRRLPGLVGESEIIDDFGPVNTNRLMVPLAEGFCLRANCIDMRKKMNVNDRGPLTDLWWDIHRLKHNTRRVDHPCQLPPRLMYRLISIFTKPGEIVLDCFNGAGTTTLAAAQLARKYIGIEVSEDYHNMALARHLEVLSRVDPFRKADRILTAKNSPVPRMPKQKYVIPKKILQLEVRRLATLLGELPSREEVAQHSKYPIEYYDHYFASWGEVCAAARTTGMSENRLAVPSETKPTQSTLFDLEEIR